MWSLGHSARGPRGGLSADGREIRLEIPPGSAMRGRRPKPTAVKKLQGNPGKRALSTREPKPEVGAPTRPSNLDDIAGAEWDRLSALTSSMKVLTKADGPILEATVIAYRDMRAALGEIAADGGRRTYQTTNENGDLMIRKHPACEVAADGWRRYVTGLSHFGLSPATRAKVQAAPEDAKDPLELWLIQGGKRGH